MTPERWEQVGQLYQSALKLRAEDRGAYLNQVCGDDESLRRELESLLAADSKVGDFLDAGAMGDAARMMAQNKSLSMIGKKLGPYQVLALVGAGGMGEVYRARDARLSRDVAIKVLPASFAKDADRLRRFEQEARATSALNHPNILTIYDIGAASPELGGAPYIVEELLEGEELRAELRQGAIPQRRAVECGQQIARGLAAAHERGIVHRDLKPENLFVTKDGRVKILDFGLAKLKPAPIGGAFDSQAPTEKKMTDPGTVLGTIGYMPPEQVRGEEADHRTDIFAFGVILYEMLSGRRPFTGDSAIEVMNAILKEEPPDLGEANAKVSPQLERIVRRCLEKREQQRFQSASDLGFALEALSVADSSPPGLRVSVGALSDQSAGKRWLGFGQLGWVAAAILLVAVAGLGVAWLGRAQPLAQTIRFTVPPPEKGNFVVGATFALSPDGQRLAFCATDASRKMLLYVRPLNSYAAQPLPGTDGADDPFWSPDSRSIGFFSQGKLKLISAAGGPPQEVCAASRWDGASWNAADEIIFASINPDVIYRVRATGGDSVPLTTLDAARGERGHWRPRFLPDGQHFLYSVYGGPGAGIYVGSLTDKAAKLVLNSESRGVYAAGYLFFVRNGALMGQAFDTRALVLTGEPFQIARRVKLRSILTVDLACFDVSESGVLAFQSETDRLPQLIWFDRSGNRLGAVGEPADYSNPWLSPDGKRLAVAIRDPQTKTRDIWLIDLARGGKTRFTSDPADDFNPTWSKDGSRIFFTSNRKGPRDLFQKKVNATEDEELYTSPEDKNVESVSPDGRWLLYNANPRASRNAPREGLWLLPLEGERSPRLFLKTQYLDDKAAISPDGRWVAYRSDESGRSEIYVATFPQFGGKQQVSLDGGDYPQWRRDGKELFFTSGNRRLMSVEVAIGSDLLEIGTPKALFEIQLVPVNFRNRYVVSGDGQQFLFITQTEDTTPAPINVVVNWMAELKR